MTTLGAAVRVLVQLPARAAVLILGTYHARVSPFLGNHCRFYPTCSVYAAEAIANFGLLKGGWLAVRRVCKCHPFHPGGLDEPPSPRRGR